MILAAITTHKRPPEMVERAIKSVIAQTYTDWNLVVVDDSPADWELRDDVRRMVEGYSRNDSRIRYVAHDRNYGAQRARNTALNIAVKEGFEFIAYLDDDDEWLPEKLSKQLEVFMRRGTDTALVYCRSYVAEHDGKIIGYEFERGGKKRTFAEGKIYEQLILFDFVGTCSNPMMRTECLKAICGWDEDMPARQDWDTWLRLSQKYEIAYTEETLLTHYLADNNTNHVGGSYATQAEGFSIIMRKNAEYLNPHKYAQWNFMKNLIMFYTESGQYGKGFSSYLKALTLQPLRSMTSTSRFMISLAKALIKRNCPFLFRMLKGIKNMIMKP